MTNPLSTTRRQFLQSAGAALVAAGTAGGLQSPRRAAASNNADADNGDYVLKSQPLPMPKIVLPTDTLGEPTGPKKRIAAVTTAYFKYSHADDIITKFIEGYAVVGRTHLPHCDVVSLYLDQTPESDIGRGMAARYRIPLFEQVADALTLGGDELAVDGVLLVGEHGDYPYNEKHQHLYPRRRLFEEIVRVFRRTGRSVPVYNDKHFSYSWYNAEWMYNQSKELGFPMMAGSSVPVTWRRPPLAFRQSITLDTALAVGFADLEAYGFHTLEVLQTFAEKRGSESVGVKSVQCLEGDAAWEAAAQGVWPVEVLPAVLETLPNVGSRSRRDSRSQAAPRSQGGSRSQAPAWGRASIDQLRAADPRAAVFLVEYTDGFQGAAYMSRGLVSEFAFGAKVHGQSEPVASWLELPKPQRDHFSFLSNHIEVMFRSGKPSYPVERTYLVTGVLEALIDSHVAGGQRVATPHLTGITYEPADEYTVG